MKTAALDAGDEIRNAFDVFDKDGDGYIDAQELREIMHSLGEEMNEDELNEMLNQADKNGDGKICCEYLGSVVFYDWACWDVGRA